MNSEREKIEIPEITYQGDDKKLKERIFKFKAGSLRIVIFTVVGFIMGCYSHTYMSDTFLPTKVILAIPYKINEALYVSVLGTDAKYVRHWMEPTIHNEFFPHSGLATFLAEVITVILISGAIYGALGYFTGDKRVFTLQRFLVFAGCWCAVILLFVGAAYAVNAKAVNDNEYLRGDPEFFLYHGKIDTSQGGGSGFYDGRSQTLRELLYDELEEIHVNRNVENEIPMHLYYELGRVGEYRVNLQDCYLVTEQGRTYQISETFADVLAYFYTTGKLPDGMNDTSVVGEAAAEVRSE